MKKSLGNIIGIPEEVISDIIKTTIVGRNRVDIEYYGRLILYTDEEISVKNDLGIVSIRGKGLKIETIDKNYMAVTGVFLCISYEN